MNRFPTTRISLKTLRLSAVLSFLLIFQAAVAQRSKSDGISTTGKTAGAADRKYVFMNANNIAVNVYNWGSISPGIGLLRHVDNFVWNGLGDLFTAGPVIGAEVKDASGNTVHILSDAINDVYARDVNPVNNTLLYGWQPLPGYANPNQGLMATNDNPNSWPTQWSSWPGLQGSGNVLAKKETYYAMDDRSNNEFQYYPFPSDSMRRGLGLEVEGRVFQFDDQDFSDVLFVQYAVKNVSPKLLAKVVAGFYIDVDVGGGSPVDANESKDDVGTFDAPHDLVYFWDKDGIGNYGLSTHYTGVMLIETPGNSTDGIDNDGDGMVDESQTNGIDDDGDWDPVTDDVGIDGVGGTHDTGEGDGVPTAGIRLIDGSLDPLHPGEPNFELRDREESDELGLTSFVAWTWGDANFTLSVDSLGWDRMHYGLVSPIPQQTDIVSLMSSGDFPLGAGTSARFSSAFIAAWDLPGVVKVVNKISDQYDSRFYSGDGGNTSLAMHIDAPLEGQSTGGDVQIRWTSSGSVTGRLVDIWYSNSYEASWNLLAHDLPDNALYAWDTRTVRDGSWYKLRVVGKKYGDRGYDISKDFFTVDNPGNGAPDIFLSKQFSLTPVTGTLMLHWEAGDPDKDLLLFRIQASSDGGAAFTPVDSSWNTHDYTLDTRTLPNSYSTVIRVEAFDGTTSSFSDSKPFAVLNKYDQIKDSVIHHVTGKATGFIRPIAVSASALTGDTYRITFDSAGGVLNYSVVDLTLNQSKVQHQPLSALVGGGTYFDGMRIGFRSDELNIDIAGSRFINAPTINLLPSVTLPTVGIAKFVPVDVKVAFNAMDTTLDGSYMFPGDTLLNPNVQKKIIAPFRVTDAADNTPLEAVVVENGSSSMNRWDPGERIVVRTPLPYRSDIRNMLLEIHFDVDTSAKPMAKGGEVFIARMLKPFTTSDTYEFVASKSNLGPLAVKDPSEVPAAFSLGQNYPNPFNPRTVISYQIPVNSVVTLKIFDVLGRGITTLVNEQQSAGTYRVDFSGKDISSGIYFYRLVAVDPKMPQKRFVETKKMLLLK